MTGTATVSSLPIPIANGDNVGVEVTFTGTPTGTVSVLVSNSGVNFYPLTMTLGQPAGAPGGYTINLNQLPYNFVQFQYVNISGTGVLNMYLLGKDLN